MLGKICRSFGNFFENICLWQIFRELNCAVYLKRLLAAPLEIPLKILIGPRLTIPLRHFQDVFILFLRYFFGNLFDNTVLQFHRRSDTGDSINNNFMIYLSVTCVISKEIDR